MWRFSNDVDLKHLQYSHWNPMVHHSGDWNVASWKFCLCGKTSQAWQISWVLQICFMSTFILLCNFVQILDIGLDLAVIYTSWASASVRTTLNMLCCSRQRTTLWNYWDHPVHLYFILNMEFCEHITLTWCSLESVQSVHLYSLIYFCISTRVVWKCHVLYSVSYLQIYWNSLIVRMI